MPGYAARNDASTTGSTCSPAVVTAASRTVPREGSASPRAAASASACSPRIVRAYPA